MSDDVRFQAMTLGSPLLALIPALALVCYLFLYRRFLKGPRSPWLAPTLLMLVGAIVWYAIGLGTDVVWALVPFCLACLTAARIVVEERLDGRIPTALTLALVTVLDVLTLELTWNERVYLIGPQFWLIELALVGLAVGVLWFGSGRRRWVVAILSFALLVLGTVQHYVLEFRGTSILPSDIMAARTALSISAGYSYALSWTMLAGGSACALALACASRLPKVAAAGNRRRPYAHDAAACALCLAAMVALVVVPDYKATFGADIDYWWSKDWYQRQGFLPSFVYAWQDLDVAKPEGYTSSAAREAKESLVAAWRESSDAETYEERRERFEQLRPNVLVIQNETFCDLSVFGGLGGSYEGPAFFNEGLSDATLRGDLAVSVFGGGTCNTEFEFLTGNSLAFLGSAKYPFTMYDLSIADSLPRDLKAAGYVSVGIHPNLASNWNRDRAYEELGFDRLYTIDDFEGAQEFHTHVSDWATYEKALELIEESDTPLFVFDVTMQNHSGYDTGSIPEELLGDYRVDGLTDEDNAQIREFVACIDESDRAFERLIGRLREVDEPTVVMMYGDHHPWFSENINDVVFPQEDALVHAERIHNTSYVIWANFDLGVAPETDNLSADLAASVLLDAIGAPLTEFQEAQLGARGEVKAINASGWRDANGTWHALGEACESLRWLDFVEYANFGSKV